jgi:hypothetical protein
MLLDLPDKWTNRPVKRRAPLVDPCMIEDNGEASSSTLAVMMRMKQTSFQPWAYEQSVKYFCN